MPSAYGSARSHKSSRTPSTPGTPAFGLTPSTLATPHSRPTMTQDAWRRVAELKDTLLEKRNQMDTLEGASLFFHVHWCGR